MWLFSSNKIKRALIFRENLYWIEILYKSTPYAFMLDSGADCNIVTQSFVDKYPQLPVITGGSISGMGGTDSNTKITELALTFDSKKYFHSLFIVRDEAVLPNIFDKYFVGILGTPFLMGSVIDFKRNIIYIDQSV